MRKRKIGKKQIAAIIAGGAKRSGAKKSSDTRKWCGKISSNAGGKPLQSHPETAPITKLVDKNSESATKAKK